VVRVPVAVLVALPLYAQSLEQAAERLARKVAVTLRAAPPVAISVENRSSLSTPAERVRAILDREINKGTTAPAGAPAVSAYMSDSASGPILIATADCGESPCVSIERFQPEPGAVRAALVIRPIIRQAAPVLDFAVTNDSLVVLETDRAAIYKRDVDGWSPAGSLPFSRCREIRAGV
jgi:hypothetical protein